MPLEELLRLLSATPATDMIVAVCDDKYQAAYSRAYIAAHHPLLVLKVDGKLPSDWPKDPDAHSFSMGPYMISQPTFKPSFKILAHSDEAQIPWGVVRLELRDEKTVFGAIAPRGPHAQDDAVQAGYRIAQQNCYRCHNMGHEGGQKAGRSWVVLAALAVASPDYFSAYVRDPEEKESACGNAWESELRRENDRGAARILPDVRSAGAPMTLRAAKVLLVFAVALFYSLVVFNNLTDYDSNYQFVRHVMMMDSTFPGNHGMWRAINSPALHTAFYVSIITWEAVAMALCWWGGVRLVKTLNERAAPFNSAKRIAIVALTVSLLQWLVAFLGVGAEWFLMWQSKTWNGQEAAFRNFAVIGIVLLLVAQPDADGQP